MANSQIDPGADERPILSTLVASRPAREGKAGAIATVTSVALHGGVVALLFWATMNVGEAVENENEMIVLLPPAREVTPPAPPPPAVIDPAPPVEGPVVPKGSVTISAPTVIAPDIPPPAIGSDFDPLDYTGIGPEGRADGDPERTVTAEDVDAAPVFTPMTVRPTIRNRDEVGRALQQYYPPLLRDAGIGGTVVVWILIDENGDVLRTQVHRSSGNDGLDAAAVRVGDVIEFTPAMNRDRAVKVWIQWPITFQSMR